MSSWMGDWERGLINKRGTIAKYRTECKVGREAILEDMPALWVTDPRLAPLGLSCVKHLQERAAELGLTLPAEASTRKVPAEPETEKGIRHGTPYAYNRLKCRCDECRKANTEANARWRANRPKKAKVPA